MFFFFLSAHSRNQKHLTYRKMISTFTSSTCSWMKTWSFSRRGEREVFKVPRVGWVLDDSLLKLDVGGLFVRRLRAGLRPVSDHTLCRLCVCVCVQDGGQRKRKGVGRSERGSQQPRSWPRALQAELVTLRKAKLKNNREANCILWLWLLYGC